MRRQFRALILPALVLLGGAGADAVLEGRTLRYEDGASLRWSRSYPAALGELIGPVRLGDTLYLGVGPVVYALAENGALRARYDLPGPVTSLDASGGTLRASTRGDGYVERFTLSSPRDGGRVQERVVFPPDPDVTGWLGRAARLVPDEALAQAVREDPLNPFLALREARQAGNDRYAALGAVRRALGGDLPFPAWVQLAAALDTQGFPAAADLALDRARRDAALRGYDPEIRVSREALGAYGNPSGYVGTLLDQNRLGRAEAWMRYLRELHPRFEGGGALYARYADVLEVQGRGGEAEEWRQFARSLRAGTLYNLGPQGAERVRGALRLLTLALGLALGAALLTLTARAWRVQGEDTRPCGGRWRSWLRRPVFRARRVAVLYARWGERLGLAALAAGLVVSVAGWSWANMTAARLQAPALNIGTYGGGWSAARLGDLGLLATSDTALLGGLAAQLDGDASAARARYVRLPGDACALNNLAVIAQKSGDAVQARRGYRAALAARPDLSAAAYNLGLSPGTPGAAFQRRERPGEPRLCYPDDRSLARAVTGDLSATLARLLRDPLTALPRTPQAAASAGQSVRLGWAFLGTLTLLGLLALSLLIPRPASAARQGRPAAYRLAALLLPGAALLEGAWGGVLLLAWGGALAALTPLTGLTRFATPFDPAAPGTRAALLTLLAVTYVLNTAAFIYAELRRARRRRAAEEA
jgi:tetratricopeptide (TPR) repeat protein